MRSTRVKPVFARTCRIGWCLLLSCGSALAQMPDPPGQVKDGAAPRHEAYLFAHMMDGDYGRLYYSVSRDGLRWKLLNGGKRVLEEYRGHPDIAKGHDGRYYLVGNRRDDRPDINFWVSEDLIAWKRHGDHVPDLAHVPDYPKAMARIGAPKLFWDEASSRYLLTWHTTHDLGRTDLPEPYWAGQRTLYATSTDMATFTQPPRKLFGWDMATIDVIVRREGDRYFAVVKDERYPSVEWPTGKTIRISSARDLLGPYSEPGPPVSPGFREAPTLIPAPDGKAWYLYYEQYPGVAYGLSAALRLDGPWFQVAGMQRPDWDKYTVPPRARHGSMLPITANEYDALVAAFGDGPGELAAGRPAPSAERPGGAKAPSGAGGPAAAEAEERARLVGLWRGFTVEGKGETPDRGPVQLELTIDDRTIRGIEVRGDRRIDHGVGEYSLDLGADPRRLDGAQTNERGRKKRYVGIYALDGETLRWCVSPQEERPESFETRKGQFLLILRRERTRSSVP